MQPRRRPGPPPQRPRPPRQRPSAPRNHNRGNALLVVILVTISLAIGAWYFLLRGSSAPSPAFIRASDRFTTSVQASLDAEKNVRRMLELANFDATIHASFVEMQRDIAIFQRLAHTESGEAATIANASATTAIHAVHAMYLYEGAVINSRNLNDAEAARAQLTGFLTAINVQADRWKKLG
jgi:hypothetical protein